MEGKIALFEVSPHLYIGSENECSFSNSKEWALIHACKSPCHQRVLGYTGSLPSTHPNYLVYEIENHLFLNMIDPPQPLFKPQLFIKSLDFIDKHIENQKVLIHCNLGKSRSPSIALLYLAKRLKKITNSSYESACVDFNKIYPYYQPGSGIMQYLSRNWDMLN